MTTVDADRFRAVMASVRGAGRFGVNLLGREDQITPLVRPGGTA
ncbi:hypothetical protein ACGFMK_46090 [Amycolatopsis sp. NPDC049252]